MSKILRLKISKFKCTSRKFLSLLEIYSTLQLVLDLFVKEKMHKTCIRKDVRFTLVPTAILESVTYLKVIFTF